MVSPDEDIDSSPRWSAGASIVGFLFGAALLFVGFILAMVALWLGRSAARPPNPFVSDDLFCCAYPDTWAEVVVGSLVAAGLAAGAAALAVVATMFVLRAIAVSRTPGPVVVWAASGIAALATVLAVGAKTVPQANHAVVRPDCGSFSFDRRAWNADGERRATQYHGPVNSSAGRLDRRGQEQMLAVVHCDVITAGMTRQQVRAVLGPPTEKLTELTWTYGPLSVPFGTDGRLGDVGIRKPERPDW